MVIFSIWSEYNNVVNQVLKKLLYQEAATIFAALF